MARDAATSIVPVAAVATPPLPIPVSDAGAGTARAASSPPSPRALEPATVPSGPALQALVGEINDRLVAAGRSLHLSVDMQSHHSVIVIRDTQTGTIIGQFPSEQILRTAALGRAPVLVDLKA